MVLNSYAKLNLYLAVLNKRSDNYHNLQTLFERISLCDKIILRPRRDRSINIISDSPGIPLDHTNLAYKSAKLLQDELRLDKGADIRIIKRIPVGSGMGGGSSNAAAVLEGLNRLWRLHLNRQQLVYYAGKLGADVPFFIYNTPFAQAEGRGDKIKPLKALKSLRLWHILAVPRIHVSTPFIYRKWDELSAKTAKNKARAGLTLSGSSVKILTLALKKKDLSLVAGALFNSLEQVTTKIYPELKRIKGRFLSAGVQAILMSGSGPAVFGIVSSRKEAVSLEKQLRAEDAIWQVFVTRTI